MVSSPFIRRTLIAASIYGIVCVMVLSLVGLSVPAVEGATIPLAVLRTRMAVAEAILLVLGLLLFARWMQHWIAPLADLGEAIRAVADGDYPPSVLAEADDEISRTVENFNQLVQAVQSRHRNLELSEQRAVRENQQSATVLEAMVEGVIAVDTDERVLLANSAAVRLLQLDASTAVGMRIWEVVRLPQILDLIRVTLTEQTKHQMEFPVPWTSRTVAAVASRLPGNTSQGVVVVLHDVTDLRRLENLRREFVSNVSHELKTPLASITAYADTLLNGALEDEAVNRDFVGRIGEEAERLNDLILELLELARIESGEHIYHLDTVELNEILRASLHAHEAIAQAKQLRLTSNLFPHPIMTLADEDGLRTMIDNLLSNAINYTSPGGWVTLRSQLARGMAEFEVQDNGVGIAQEHQQRIFERFFRVDKARSRETGGTGLGLSIVKHLCQLFDGNIKVKSQLGKGSTFTVTLKTPQPNYVEMMNGTAHESAH